MPPKRSARVGKEAQAAAVTVPKAASNLGFQKEYNQINDCFENMVAREDRDYRDVHSCEGDSDDDYMKPVRAPDGTPLKLNGVNLSAALSAVPENHPYGTTSTTNKFCILVFNMLRACEHGGMGGDACRQNLVLAAAGNDAMGLRIPWETRGEEFEHLLGYTLACLSHGLETWILRADPDFDLFQEVGAAWRKLFKIPKEELVSEGISEKLREHAFDVCEALRKHLKSFGHKSWEGSGARVYAFNYKPALKPHEKAEAAAAKEKVKAEAAAAKAEAAAAKEKVKAEAAEEKLRAKAAKERLKATKKAAPKAKAKKPPKK